MTTRDYRELALKTQALFHALTRERDLCLLHHRLIDKFRRQRAQTMHQEAN